MADYNFKGNVDIAAIASLIQRKAVQEFEMKEAVKNRRLREIQAIVDIGGKLASGAVAAAKYKQQKDFADALAFTKMTPGYTEQVPDQYAQEPTTSMVPPPEVGMRGDGATPPLSAYTAGQPFPVVEGVEQPDGTVAPQPPVAVPAHEIQHPPTDNPTSIAIRKGAMVDPEQTTRQFMEKEFATPGQFGMYGGGTPVRNKQTGERAFAQFGKDGSVVINGQRVPPAELVNWDREYAPQAVETTGGVVFADKTPGNTVSTAGAAADPKQGKITRDSYTVPELRHLDKVKASLEGDNVFQKINERENELAQAEASLDTSNWVGDATIPSLLAKGLGRDAGALSDQDQKRYQVSPEVWRRIKTKWNKWVNGELTDADREDVREALRVAGLKNQELKSKRVDIYERKAMAGVRNGNKEFVRSYLSGDEATPEAGAEASGIDGIAQLLGLPKKKGK